MCILYSMQVHDCCAWYADICMCDCVCVCAYVYVRMCVRCMCVRCSVDHNPIPPVLVAYAGIG